jgi:hypothetical protein
MLDRRDVIRCGQLLELVLDLGALPEPAVSTSEPGALPFPVERDGIAVIPASGPVIIRSSPSIRFTSVDLPAFGRPTMASFSGRSGSSSSSSSSLSSSSRSTNGRKLSNKSTTPSPCSALMAIGSPRPRA